MFDVFRFVNLRSPEKSSSRTISIPAEGELLSSLLEARQQPSPVEKMRVIVDEFAKSNDFVRDLSSLHFGDGFQKVSAYLGLEIEELEDLDEAISTNFGKRSDQLISDSDFKIDVRRVHDSLIATKIGGMTSDEFDPPQIALVARIAALVARIAEKDKSLLEKGALENALGLTIVLPGNLLPLPNEPKSSSHANGEMPQPQSPDAAQRYERLQKAAKLIERMTIEDVEMDVVRISPTPEIQPTSETERIFRDRAGQIVVDALKKLETDNDQTASKISTWQGLRQFAYSENITTAQDAPDGNEERRSVALIKPLLNRGAIARFSPELVHALTDLDIQLEKTPIATITGRISAELTKLTPEVGALVRPPVINPREVVPIGNNLYPRDGVIEYAVLDANQNVDPLPRTKGTARPIGVADLLIVKEQLIGYELGEIAHIENVLEGETYRREVQRTETTEESTVTEEETIREEERDLQSTNRFELQSETQNIIRTAGINPQGQNTSLGPVLTFEGTDQRPVEGSQELSQRKAESFSQEVTSRAASHISERARKQVSRRVVRQYQEKADHEFNNSDGQRGNVTGIYQWLNKIHQAQLFNYGKRLMYDFVVPEPAAFVIEALARKTDERPIAEKPEPLAVPTADGNMRPLQPNDLDETNYAYYVGKYSASSVKEPPELWHMVSKLIVGSAPPSPRDIELVPPEGYDPYLKSIFTPQYETRVRRVENSSTAVFSDESLDITIVPPGHSWRATLWCERQASHFQKWQLATYNAIVSAHKQQVREFEERIANARAALRLGSIGLNPDQKRTVERNEIKKACISLLTYQHFDLFNGIEADFPQLDLTITEQQGPYIRFFEQVIEWENMNYAFYPYYWGRKGKWVDKFEAADSDPQFREFLSSGAARVLLPVRPGFERALIHFMETGEVWTGGELPAANSEMYVPLLDELKKAPPSSAPVPQGNPWKIKLPTSLVMLRANTELPKWHERDGEWVLDE